MSSLDTSKASQPCQEDRTSTLAYGNGTVRMCNDSQVLCATIDFLSGNMS
jgi:hypothetical protein